MGVSTDAILCYGVAFEEDHEFPWEYHHEGAEDWFYSEIMRYVPLHRLYDDDGLYLKDIPLEMKKAEWNHYREFKTQNPMPFRVVEHCSNEYTMYILTVPSTYFKASRGHPKEIESFMVLGKEYEEFVSFLQMHEIAHDVHPKWLLASYWG